MAEDVLWELGSRESSDVSLSLRGACTSALFKSVSSTCSLVRFWPAKIGDGSSFLGDVTANSARLTGLPVADAVSLR